MRLRDFISTDKELPPVDVYVLGYWEGEPKPLTVVRYTQSKGACAIWYGDDGELVPPTKWHHLPGGRDLNNANFIGEAHPDWDVEAGTTEAKQRPN